MAELGLLEEFQEEKLVLASDRLNEYVENGTMSRETADAALAAIKERQKNCDGTETVRQRPGERLWSRQWSL